MPDAMKETKQKIIKLISRWTPLEAWGVKLSLSYTRGGFLLIKHKGHISEHFKTFIEGMLIGANLCPSYYPDSGPCDCWQPSIEWRRTDRIVDEEKTDTVAALRGEGHRPAKRKRVSKGLSERDLADAMCSGCGY